MNQQLLRQVRACKLCEPKLPLGANPVLQWHPQAKILIAGQAPGRKVHASGQPFTDASGERLRTWLGVDAESFYDPKVFAILPMAFCYPGTGKSGDLPPPPECAETWRQQLMAPLQSLQLVLAVGQYAQQWHLPEFGGSVAEKVQQSFQHGTGGKPHVFALPHPSPRNNRWLKQHQWFEEQCLPQLKHAVARAIDGHSKSG
ncbi:uracil-DNA glycosylase [Idiomarina tyrosinivorans]|uniref:Uracil-DNA glycosylase n=1 Tax=Idiomarina tyrosinivorans TaxID=1445662 RepID=A0A432ZSD8_9GAMM|nr:uracil-DNA glycosylase family protein [Idiomarina tyrosinivorans]RUO80746.1 uracil-DNA glycosylase [Idiomarina tyrosinivorans]